MPKGATVDFLAQDAAYFKEILDSSGVGFWEHDARSGQSTWSPYLFRLLGRPEGKIPAGTDGWLTLVHPDDLPSVRARMEAALAPDNPLYLAEFRMQHSDGRWLWVQARGRVIERDANGHVRRTAGTLSDITEKKERESARRQSEERLRLITESIDEVFWLADVSLDTMFYVSPAYERIWQRPARDLYAHPRSFLEAIHPDDLEGVLAELDKQSQGLPFDHEYRIVRPDGSIRWIWDRGFPISEPHSPVTRYAGLAQDITERKQAETEILRLNAELETRVAQRTAELEATTRELQDSQERFRVAMESSHIGVWEWNLQTGSVHYSSVLTERLACDPAELARDPVRTWQHLLHPEDRAIAAATGSQLRESGRVDQEFRLRAKDGSYFWILSRGRVVEWDSTGAPLRVIGIHADIDARKRAEALNRRLAAIIEAGSDMIGTATPEGVIDYMNRAGRAWLGIGANESLEHARIQDYHPAWAYRRVMEEGFPAALAEGEWLGDTTMRRRDGSEFPVSQLILGHRDPMTGKIEFMSTICRDLSERVKAEQALRRLQQEQALILDSAPALIWYKDTENRILRVNAAAAESLGLPKDRIEGHPAAEFYPEDADRYYQDDLAVIRSGQPRLGIEEPYRLPSGEQRWLQTDKVPLIDDDGQVTRLLVMSMDITERKRIEAALRDADRQKDEFLATLAHELRNPLAPIRTGLHVLHKTVAPNPDTDRLLTMMSRQVIHLARLVDDLLEVSRITRGKIKLRKERVDLGKIISHALDTSRPLIEAGHHRLEVSLPPNPLRIEADPVRLTQVFANLLNNAAKYTPPGGTIRVTAELRGGEAVVRVADTGEGIPAELLPRVFDLFTQADRTLERSQGGLGIGLALVRHLVAMHGGTVTVRSAGLGEGSEFVVHLPMLAEPPTVQPQSGQ